ncbi:MAG: peptidylprolyl isomerase [Anaerolineae bacterium]|nr:peptidylprolyl isomerase [Anaerolineae bacterium]
MENATVQKDSVVTLEYTVRLKDDEILDSNVGGEPLTYLHGYGMIISGLEEALNGMPVGKKQIISVPPEKAYGTRLEDATEWLPLSIFPSDVQLGPGAAMQVEDGEGGTIILYVREVNDEQVLVDYNHPLAGETLTFEVKVLDMRPATAEELAHGHVHHHGHEH